MSLETMCDARIYLHQWMDWIVSSRCPSVRVRWGQYIPPTMGEYFNTCPTSLESLPNFGMPKRISNSATPAAQRPGNNGVMQATNAVPTLVSSLSDR